MTLENQKQETVWSENESPSIKTFTLANFRELPQIQQMSEEKQFEMENTVAAVADGTVTAVLVSEGDSDLHWREGSWR